MFKLPDKNQLLNNFNCCSNWEDKYLYIIQLGHKLSKPSKMLYTHEHMITGCQSKVWIRMTRLTDGTVFFEGDSNASIVKGLIAVIFILYQGLSAEEICMFDIYKWFSRLNLINYLTPLRAHGLQTIIKKIRYHSNLLCFKNQINVDDKLI